MSKPDTADITRRLALKRLGLAVGAAYIAPVVMNLSDAKASSGSSGGGSGGGGGGAGAGAGGSGSSSEPSEASMSEASMSGPSDDDTADSGGTDTTPGQTIKRTASAVAKVPGKIVNGVRNIFR